MRPPVNQPSPGLSRLRPQSATDLDLARAQSWPAVKAQSRQMPILEAAAGRQTLHQKQQAELATTRLTAGNSSRAATPVSLEPSVILPAAANEPLNNQSVLKANSQVDALLAAGEAQNEAEEASFQAASEAEGLSCGIDTSLTVETRKGRRIQKPSRLRDYS